MFLLFSWIEGTIFALKSYTEYTFDFMYHKKGTKWTKFLFDIKNRYLNGFKIIRTITFCSQEGSFSKLIFHSSGIFPQNIWSRKFSTKKFDEIYFPVTEIFHNIFHQVNFPQSRNFSIKYLIKEISTKNLIKNIFHSQRNFPQKGSLKAKTSDQFNTKSHAKIFLAL